jgi:hypothetical protein
MKFDGTLQGLVEHLNRMYPGLVRELFLPPSAPAWRHPKGRIGRMLRAVGFYHSAGAALEELSRQKELVMSMAANLMPPVEGR